MVHGMGHRRVFVVLTGGWHRGMEGTGGMGRGGGALGQGASNPIAETSRENRGAFTKPPEARRSNTSAPGAQQRGPQVPQ